MTGAHAAREAAQDAVEALRAIHQPDDGGCCVACAVNGLRVRYPCAALVACENAADRLVRRRHGVDDGRFRLPLGLVDFASYSGDGLVAARIAGFNRAIIVGRHVRVLAWRRDDDGTEDARLEALAVVKRIEEQDGLAYLAIEWVTVHAI